VNYRRRDITDSPQERIKYFYYSKETHINNS